MTRHKLRKSVVTIKPSSFDQVTLNITDVARPRKERPVSQMNADMKYFL